MRLLWPLSLLAALGILAIPYSSLRLPLSLLAIFMLALALVLWSPTAVFLGKQRVPFDIALASSLLLLFSPMVLDGNRYLQVAGLLVLLACCIALSRTRWHVLCARMLLAYVAFLAPLAAWALHAPPFLVSAAALACLAAARKVRLCDLRALFSRRKRALLGLSGLLILDFTLVVSSQLVLLAPQYAMAHLAILPGYLALAALPAYMWWKVYENRTRGQHPDWHTLIVALLLAAVVAALLSSAIRPLATTPVTLALAPLHLQATLVGAGVAFVAATAAGMLSDRLRRILMLAPLIAGVVALAWFAYAQLESSLAHLFSLAFPLPLAPQALLLLFEAFFLVLGFSGFLYELWRE